MTPIPTDSPTVGQTPTPGGISGLSGAARLLDSVGPTFTCSAHVCLNDAHPLGHTSLRHNPLDGLIRDHGDAVEVGVIVQDGEPGRFCAGRHQQIRQRDSSMLGAGGEKALYLKGTVDGRLRYRNTGKRSEYPSQFGIGVWARRAEEQLQINDPAGGDATRQQ